ncbi:helix-turn-helix domain-containing protein [Alteribacillus sp. HJP-4]|uniref:AraC family transcriptional regulator n=1 Tax=Alteribacillus sp. HJP-4 TaxID=2775394 RepID=UPI0035CD301E
MTHKRYVLSPLNDQHLPVYVETIGYYSDEKIIKRPFGYPFFHWIQTINGEGVFETEGKTIPMPPHSGILLFPDIAHQYKSVSSVPWETAYVTFGGAIVPELMEFLKISRFSYFKWEEEKPLSTAIQSMLKKIHTDTDVFGLQLSADLYQFLLTLQKYGNGDKQKQRKSEAEKLSPLLQWMEQHYENPAVGLNDLARVIDVSARQLNILFRETFHVTPYAYFLHIRIRKAKYLLIEEPETSVKDIAKNVGFRDVSHFVATFRRIVGLTPEKYRGLH